MVFVSLDLHDSFYIWNPSTGLFLKLPNPSNELGLCDSCPRLPRCGFGYVSATDDYKVFVAGRFRNSTIPVEMYSSKANSWKMIEPQPLFSKGNCTKPKGTFLNEALHWLDHAVPEGERKPTIIAFDLVKEKFREMPLPLLKQDDRCGGFFSDMGVVSGGCLCVPSYDGDGYYCGDYIQLWIMMDYGVCESWTKWIKLVDDDQLQPPFAYWEKSIVMVSDDREKEYPEWNQELVRFDHKEDTLDEVAVCSGRYRFEVGDFDMTEYDESLLWLHDYQGAEGR
jgi:F-box interacting protein